MLSSQNLKFYDISTNFIHEILNKCKLWKLHVSSIKNSISCMVFTGYSLNKHYRLTYFNLHIARGGSMQPQRVESSWVASHPLISKHHQFGEMKVMCQMAERRANESMNHHSMFNVWCSIFYISKTHILHRALRFCQII